MTNLYLPHLLKTPERRQTVTVETHFPELATLMPVRGSVTVRHGQTFLEVQGQGETIVTLTCDRCLQQYNHRLTVEAEELIWLEDQAAADLPLEQELSPEELVETLSPDGHFDPENWLYEQLCLALPQRQLCDNQCPGIPLAVTPTPLVDHRWAALAALQTQIPQDAEDLP